MGEHFSGVFFSSSGFLILCW